MATSLTIKHQLSGNAAGSATERWTAAGVATKTLAMLLEDLYAMPGHLIRRSQQIAVSAFMAETAAFGLTPVQYAALVAIRERPNVDATRLAHLIAFDRSTIGNVLERLEGKGLVARKSSPEDKRTKLLRITRRGSSLLNRIYAAVERAQERMLAPLTTAERRQLMALLAKIVHLNNVHDGDAPQAVATLIDISAYGSRRPKR